MANITDRDVEQARKNLGDSVKDWSDEKLKDELVKVNYLVESWLDDFERSIFNGKTLAEMYPEFNVPNLT